MYVEDVADGRAFVDAARAAARKKPVVVLAAGTSEAGRRGAASHTGALVSDQAVLRAACEAAGALLVESPGRARRCAARARLLAASARPARRGDRRRRWTRRGLRRSADARTACESPSSRPRVVAQLDAALPPHGGIANPVDLIGVGDPELNAFSTAARIVLASGRGRRRRRDRLLRRLRALLGRVRAQRAGRGRPAGRPADEQRRARCWPTACTRPTPAAPRCGPPASRSTSAPSRPPARSPDSSRLPRRATRRRRCRCPTAAAPLAGPVGYVEARALLADAGLPYPDGSVAHDAGDAVAAADRLGLYPVTLKAVDASLLHKSDRGGVRVGLPDAAALHAAALEMERDARARAALRRAHGRRRGRPRADRRRPAGRRASARSCSSASAARSSRCSRTPRSRSRRSTRQPPARLLGSLRGAALLQRRARPPGGRSRRSRGRRRHDLARRRRAPRDRRARGQPAARHPFRRLRARRPRHPASRGAHAMNATRTRIGGHLVVDCLEAAGARAVFGVPGIHALAIWDGLADSSLRYVGMRTELSAGFAADGYARAGGRPGVLLTTTGPGSFVATCALMEARTSYVPLVNIVSQVPRDVIGTNRGFLHELPTQSQVLASFAKWHAVARGIDEVPDLIAEAFRQATSAPSGPVVLEIPVDVLEGETDLPAPRTLDVAPVPLPAADPALLAEAAGLLESAERPVLWAGGGVLRAGGVGGVRRARRAPRRTGRHDLHGQGRDPGRPPARRRLGLRRGRVPGAPAHRRRRARRRHRARRRDDRPVVAPLRGPPDPGRRARRAPRRDVRGARHRRRRARGARGARAARLAARVRRPGTRPGRPRSHLVRPRVAGPRGRAAPARRPPRRARTRRHPGLRHDADRLPRRAVPRRLRARHVPLPARLGHARLRLAGGDRREGRAARCPGARRARRRRRALQRARAALRAPARDRRQAARGRRRRLRDPARLPGGRVRPHEQGRPRAARLPGARALARRAGLRGVVRARSPVRSPRRSRSTGPPSSTCRRRSCTRRRRADGSRPDPRARRDPAAQPPLPRRAPAARRAAVRARGRPAGRRRSPASPGASSTRGCTPSTCPASGAARATPGSSR